MTTLFGVDAGSYQKGLSLAALQHQGYSFFIAKCTEGHSWVNPLYTGWLAEAESVRFPFKAYHFLHSDSSPAAQADHLLANIGDKSVPVMLDVESEGSSKPTMTHVNEFLVEADKRGLNVVSIYLPEWYWGEIGGPNIPARLSLVASNYGGNPKGYGSAIYPGDSSPRWAGYGGTTPTILQFGSEDEITGFAPVVDVNAIKQTDLHTLFKVWDVPKPPAPPAPHPQPKPPAVPTVSLSAVQAAARHDAPANGSPKEHKADVLPLEKALAAEKLLGSHYVDGSYGTTTVAAYKIWQQKQANGVPDEESLVKLGHRHGFKVVP